MNHPSEPEIMRVVAKTLATILIPIISVLLGFIVYYLFHERKKRKKILENIRSRGRIVKVVDDPMEISFVSGTRHIKIVRD